MLDVLGEELPCDRPYDGISLLPFIDGELGERPEPIGFQFGSQAALSDSRYKLIHNLGQKRHRSDNGQVPYAEWELYDLHDDPQETRNLAEQHPEIVAQMRSQLSAWQASCQESDRGTDYKE